MDQSLKQRLVGAVVLVALAVIFVPMILDGPGDRMEDDHMPPEPAIEAQPPAIQSQPQPSQPAVPPDAAEAPPQPPPAPAEEAGSAPTEAEGETGSSAGDPSEGTKEGDGWIVQLASFTEQANAVRLRDRLQGKGYSAFIEKAQADEGTVYRVRVGPEVDRARAQALHEAIANEIDIKGMVMQTP